MDAKAGYLATAAGIQRDNGIIYMWVMVSLVRARQFSMVVSVHSTPDFYDLVVWGSMLLYIHIKFTALIQMGSWDWHCGHMVKTTQKCKAHSQKFGSGIHHHPLYDELGDEHDSTIQD